MSTNSRDPEEGREDEQPPSRLDRGGEFNKQFSTRTIQTTVYDNATQRMNDICMYENDPTEYDDKPLTDNDASVSTKLTAKKSFPFYVRIGPVSLEPEVQRDYYFDYTEQSARTLSTHFRHKKSKVDKVPSLKECQEKLKNKEAAAHRRRQARVSHRAENVILNVLAALFIYAINTLGYDSLVMIANACVATWFFINHAPDYQIKIDFAFLAFAIIFPLTFLIQQTFNRRDQALIRLADFKACILSLALMTFTVDWAPIGNSQAFHGGRLNLPEKFCKEAFQDFENIVLLTYEYLSMPTVSHARNVVFLSKQRAARRVHGIQNDIVKLLNGLHFSLSLHTEIMRKCGFPSGEASRLHQYHQYLQQRFEQLRLYKYYRTPQSTRSFGRMYILILPWICGPYFNWVTTETGEAYAIVLAGFTFLVLLGLLNVQKALEDPFVPGENSIFPGIDIVKLDFEMASTLQALEQIYLLSNEKDDYSLQHASTLTIGSNENLDEDQLGVDSEKTVAISSAVRESIATTKDTTATQTSPEE